jgi:hypothetical protein
MDSKGLAALLVGRPEARRGEEVLNMSSRYTYYEIYPSPHVRDWQNVHFGYTEHSNQERLGAACIAHVLKNPAEACSALPTCLGYTSDCLVGMSSANSSFIHGGKKNMNYYYHEKILEHAAISWIYENPIVSAFLVGIYILFVEVVYRKTRGAVYK